MHQKIFAIVILGGAAVAPVPLRAQPAVEAKSTLQSFIPSFGDLMNMLVQPRHAKLGIAGREQNWPLAAYGVHELKDALEKIARTQAALPQQFGGGHDEFDD